MFDEDGAGGVKPRSLFVGGMFYEAGEYRAGNISQWTTGTPPTILHQPTRLERAVASDVLIPAVMTGTPPREYQWYHDGLALSDDGHVSGSATATLEIASVGPRDAGTYTLSITNACGVSETTPIDLQVLTSLGDMNCDGRAQRVRYRPVRAGAVERVGTSRPSPNITPRFRIATPCWRTATGTAC